MSESRDSLLRVLLIGTLLASPVAVPAALAQDAAEAIEEVVVVGSRRAGRSATDSPVPVDVMTSDDLENQGTQDMDDMLRNLLPSYNVQRFPISDAASITRPATLRGLPPDSTLVLVNGKRRHRSSVIAELGGSLAAGAQGPDLATIPALAIERVEVLRDGASAQYGSDAIAGVINFVLKEDNQGLTAEARYGETYEGDGESRIVGGNLGVPLGPNGFANATLQWKEVEDTDRSLQRTDAQALIDTGNTEVGNPAQIWGAPEVDDDWAFFLNSGIELTDTQELYGFGNYSERKVDGGFFFRNPNNRANVFTDSDGVNRAIIDLDLANQEGQTSNCPTLVSPGGTPTDQAAVDTDRSALNSMPSNCWAANFIYPGGYTPRFGGKVEDLSGLVGLRGTFEEGNISGMTYDVSVGLARNESQYRIRNTWNPSLGPESPTDFDLGKYIQTEQNYNVDFTYPLAVDFFYSDLNIAWGGEYREETFEIRQGEPDSWRQGPYANQNFNTHLDTGTPLVPMVVGAHGFAGFGPEQTGEWDRANWAFYTDLEADVTENILIGVAVRYEDYDDFGDTINGKLSGRWAMTPDFSLRGSVSTGFRAPTPGQSNVTKISTITVDGELQQRGQVPPTNPVASALGGQALDNEEATNISIGAAWDITDTLSLTIDYFNINVEDRISQTGTIDISGSSTGDTDSNGNLLYPGLEQQCGDINLSLCLQVLGVPGAGVLSSVSFFTNDFETTTQGVDIVGTYVHDWGNWGVSNFTAAWNWTETDVDDAGAEVDRNRVVDLENFNPENRGVFTWNHLWNDWRFLFRGSYYDDWTEGDYTADPVYNDPSDPNGGSDGNNYNISCIQGNDNCYDGEWIFDAEIAYTIRERYTITLGGQNVFDQDAPDDAENTATGGFSNNSGQEFTSSSPWGLDGGFWYLRLRADFNTR